MDKKLLYDTFKEVLTKDDSNLSPLYRNLFFTINEEDLYNTLEFTMQCYTGEVKLQNSEWYKENWFYNFHKSIRQVDFVYDTLYKKIVHDERTEEEKEWQKELAKFLNDKWNKSEHKKRKGSMWAYWANYHKEELKEYNKLKKKEKVVEYKDCSVIIDSMLWNLIAIDSKRVLEKIFIRTFKEYELQQELNKI